MYTAPSSSDRITLKPGEHRVLRSNGILSTLLGSCISACLYDEVSQISGMNHFLLAHHRYSRTLPVNVTEAGRYGIHAMELLINDMMKLGAARNRLKAKIFGGSQILETSKNDSFPCVGDINCRFIREFLTTEQIDVVSEDLGGNLGRVIHFHTDSYQVFRRYIQKNETIGIERQEHDFWTNAIKEQVKPEDFVLFK